VTSGRPDPFHTGPAPFLAVSDVRGVVSMGEQTLAEPGEVLG